MCIICIEFKKGKLTTGEATRALVEMSSELGGHVLDVQELIRRQMDVEYEALGKAVDMNPNGKVSEEDQIEIDREYHLDEGATD